MTTTITMCNEHTPNKIAISDVGDEQFTFCEICEQNISRYYGDFDPERLPEWSDWYVTK